MIIYPDGNASPFIHGNGYDEGFNSSVGSCHGYGRKYATDDGSGTGYGFLNQYRGDGYGHGFSSIDHYPRGAGYGEYPYSLIQYFK